MSHKHPRPYPTPLISSYASAHWNPCCRKKGLIDPAALDELIDTYEHKVGPPEMAHRLSPERGATRNTNVD